MPRLRDKLRYLLSGLDLELSEDPAEVGGYGALGDEQLRCDLPAGKSLGHELCALSLADG
jgi:hypothetical protein